MEAKTVKGRVYKRTKTPQDYFEFLKEVYNKITKEEKILIQSLLREKTFPVITSAVMQSGGIVKNIGSKKVPKYIWNTCIPNVHMAEKLYEEVYKGIKTTNDKTQVRKEKSKPVCVVWNKQHLTNTGQGVVDLKTDESSSDTEYVDLNLLMVEKVTLKEEEAVLVLKHLGYKIMKPVTQWEEI